MSQPANWSPDAVRAVEVPTLIIPVLTVQPMWLALSGEVALRRAALGHTTILADFDRLNLFDSEQDSHFSRVNSWARPFRQDPLSRLRKVLNRRDSEGTIQWARISPNQLNSTLTDVDPAVQHLLDINVMSESLSLTRSSRPLEVMTPESVDRMRSAWMHVYRIVRLLIEEQRPDGLLIFNGRFTKEGAARAAALATSTPVFGFDQGSRRNTIALYRNHIHDRFATAEAVEHTWPGDDTRDGHRLAEDWYRARVSTPGGGGNDHSSAFASNAPAEPAPGRTQVAVFTSSSDELVSIDTDSDATPENQVRWLRLLRKWAVKSPDYDIRVRIHPNLATKSAHDQKEWTNLQEGAPDNFIVYGPDSGANSYALVQASDLILTFGSTLTAESAFLSRPVVELCETCFTLLGICSSARSLEELAPFLAHPELALRDGQELQALKFGFWVKMGGDDLLFACLEDPEGSIDGVALEPFGRAYRFARRGYRQLVRHSVFSPLRSSHGDDVVTREPRSVPPSLL